MARILMTGASSFTGFWFARELAQAGHHVSATFRGHADDYVDIRAMRVGQLRGVVEPLWQMEFGDDRFLAVVSSQDFDLILLHGSEMSNYRSWDFDALEASRRNTRSGREVLRALASRGCQRIVHTGSVFEPYEGVGDSNRAFNPYGLSKHLTFEWFRMEAERLGLSTGKFIIPNPFGPYEEFRFTSYLAREWAQAKLPTVGTPAYVRDNIHVSLLALAYRDFCIQLPQEAGLYRCAPAGYAESQGSFAHRMAREIGRRTGWPCAVEEAFQSDFPEPLFRVNAQIIGHRHTDWSEDEAWNQLAAYYQQTFLNT